MNAKLKMLFLLHNYNHIFDEAVFVCQSSCFCPPLQPCKDFVSILLSYVFEDSTIYMLLFKTSGMKWNKIVSLVSVRKR